MFKTIADVRAANRANGGHFFSRGTMRMFGSIVESGLYGGRYFITSELDMNGQNRRYTIREARPDGDIRTVGDYWKMRTLEEAREKVRGFVAREKLLSTLERAEQTEV